MWLERSYASSDRVLNDSAASRVFFSASSSCARNVTASSSFVTDRANDSRTPRYVREIESARVASESERATTFSAAFVRYVEDSLKRSRATRRAPWRSEAGSFPSAAFRAFSNRACSRRRGSGPAARMKLRRRLASEGDARSDFCAKSAAASIFPRSNSIFAASSAARAPCDGERRSALSERSAFVTSPAS